MMVIVVIVMVRYEFIKLCVFLNWPLKAYTFFFYLKLVMCFSGYFVWIKKKLHVVSVNDNDNIIVGM